MLNESIKGLPARLKAEPLAGSKTQDSHMSGEGSGDGSGLNNSTLISCD